MSLRLAVGSLFLLLAGSLVFLSFRVLASVEELRESQLEMARINLERGLVEVVWSDLGDILADLAGVEDPRPILARARTRTLRLAREAVLVGGGQEFGREVEASLQSLAQALEGSSAEVRVELIETRRRIGLGLDQLFLERSRVAEAKARSAQLWLIAVVAVVGLEIVLVWLVLERLVTRRIEKLSEGARQVADGNLDLAVAVRGHDELGDLARSFEAMAGNLRERFEAEAKLRKQLVRSEALATLGEMAAAVAHALGNPLASLRATAQVGIEIDEAAAPRFRRILEVVDRMEKHVSGFLSFARDGRRLPAEIELNASVRGVTALLEPARRTRLELALGPEVGSVQANPEELERAILALVENALEAASEEVSISTRVEDDAVVVAVADDGPGIPAELRARVFDPFFSTKGQGTGLGLTVARQVARSLGGEVRIVDDGEPGATLELWIPR